MNKVKWVKLLSLFTSFRLISHLLFLFWKSVENNQPLIHLSTPCLFPLYLIIRTLFYFQFFCYFRLESTKGKINSGPTHCIVTMCLMMTIDKDCCIAKAKTVLHWIRKQVYFIRKRYKVRFTMLFCYISSCVLNPLLYTTNQYFSCMFHRPLMIRIKTKNDQFSV